MAKSGNTRLRVIMSDASATTSCYSYGETEDYTVSITGGTLASAEVASLTAGAPALNTTTEKP